jgi:FKBP-type peptidyl-prolyl cis-trans isomerase 2
MNGYIKNLTLTYRIGALTKLYSAREPQNTISNALKNLSLTALIGLPLVACSAAPVVVHKGDRVEMSFTCRLPGGELAATTRPDASVAGVAKSPFYLPHTGPETVSVTAGPQEPSAQKLDRQPFEQEIIERLTSKIAGLKEGEQAQWRIEADRYPVSSPVDKQVKMATVRKRQKEMRLSVEEYSGKTGRSPEVGQKFVLDKLVPGQVSEVTEKEVVIRFAPVKDTELVTPFGPVTVREMADHYELDIAAEKGVLIRTGGMVGRIIAVDKESMTIDYRHPFADEKLNCEVTVVKVAPQLRKEDALPLPTPPQQAAEAVNVTPGAELDPKISGQLEEALRRMNVQKQAEPAAVATSGDLATVNYTAMLEDGSVFYTTRKEVADDPAMKKAAWFAAPKSFTGEQVPVGKTALFPGIGEALNSMVVGSSKRLTVPPEAGFGLSDPQKIQQLPLRRTMPRTVTVSAEEYVKRFTAFPVAGQEIPLTPYFPGKVAAVREREVDLVLLAEDGKTFSEPFGSTTIKVDGESITTDLSPVIGAIFPGQSGYGVITASDATSFTVDMNNPLAGKTVTIDLELTSLTRVADLPSGDLPWQEDHDAALAQAKKENKPVVLVLHAEWCSFCKKMFSETMPDPRISSLRDKFAWVRVNSDKLTDFKKLYGQDGYPLIVLFRGDGSVVQKLDGYKDAAVLRGALQELF